MKPKRKALFIEQHQRLLYTLLRKYLPSVEALPIMDLLYFWNVHHGDDWLFQRMKQLSLAMLGKQSPTVAMREGLIKGPFKSMHRRMNSSLRVKRFYLRFLKLHGLSEKIAGKEDYDLERRRLELINDGVSVEFNVPSRAPLNTYYKPVISTASKCAGAYQSSKLGLEPYDFHVTALQCCPTIVRDNWAVLERFVGLPFEEFLFPLDDRPEHVGTCTLLSKDGSNKLRLVYNPFRIFQWALDPLYQDLYEYARRLPNMFFLDQDAGKFHVYSLLQDSDCGSIDLQAASDSLPLKHQLKLLTALFPFRADLIKLFGDVSRAAWRTPFDTYISHRVGQPMGLNVSFLSFSIYLYQLLIDEGITEFAQVGDDLVVTQSQKAINLLNELKIPLSASKSLHGAAAEFTGTFITRDDGDLQTFKARKGKYLTLLANFGKTALPFIPRWSRAFFYVVQLPAPLGFGDDSSSNLLAQLPGNLIWDLYKPKVKGYFPINSYPYAELQRYSELFYQAVMAVRAMPEGMAQKVAMRSLSETLSPASEIWALESNSLNFLAESANVLIKEGYTLEEVKHHLTTIGNIYGIKTFQLKFAVIDNPGRSVPSRTGVHTINKCFPPIPKEKPKMSYRHKTSQSHTGVTQESKKHHAYPVKSSLTAGGHGRPPIVDPTDPTRACGAAAAGCVAGSSSMCEYHEKVCV